MNKFEAIVWQVTPEDWSTGADIKVIPTNEEWELHISLLAKKRDYLFTNKDRIRMHTIRDQIVSKINN